jgi:hypothetical protein
VLSLAKVRVETPVLGNVSSLRYLHQFPISLISSLPRNVSWDYVAHQVNEIALKTRTRDQIEFVVAIVVDCEVCVRRASSTTRANLMSKEQTCKTTRLNQLLLHSTRLQAFHALYQIF